MANAPSKIPYWKVEIQEKGEAKRFEFLTALQIQTRRQLGQVITGDATKANMYEEVDGTFRPRK